MNRRETAKIAPRMRARRLPMNQSSGSGRNYLLDRLRWRFDYAPFDKLRALRSA